MKIFTSQFRYSGQDRLDITYGSRDSDAFLFKPDKLLVLEYKAGNIDQEIYKELYLEFLQLKIDKYPSRLLTFARERERSEGSATFVCYCRKGDFCHRVLCAEYLVKEYGVLFEYGGER
jgi:hypothetical protein